MTARNVSDGIGHREDRESEREGHSKEPDSKLGKSRGQYRAPTATEHQPECAYKLRGNLVS